MLCLPFPGKSSLEETLPQTKILGVFGISILFDIQGELSNSQQTTRVQ